MKIPEICRYCGGVIRPVPARSIYGEPTDQLGMEGETVYQCQKVIELCQKEDSQEVA